MSATVKERPVVVVARALDKLEAAGVTLDGDVLDALCDLAAELGRPLLLEERDNPQGAAWWGDSPE